MKTLREHIQEYKKMSVLIITLETHNMVIHRLGFKPETHLHDFAIWS